MDGGRRDHPENWDTEGDVDDDLDEGVWEEMGARRGPRPRSEGVRVIGADEAAAALESGQVARRKPGDSPRFGDVPEAPPGPRPRLTFPGDDPQAVSKPPVSGRPGWSDVPSPDESDFWDDAPRRRSDLLDEELFGSSRRPTRPGTARDPDGTGSLPHWTEPPSGEVPRIPGGEQGEDDLSAWSSLGARPRWRDQPTDWERSDFDDVVLDDDDRQGALRSLPEQDPFSFDDEPEAEPARAPAGARARPRARGGRGGATPPPARASNGGGGLRPGGFGPRESSAGGGDGRDVPTRVITGVVAAAVVLFAAIIGPAALAVLVGAILVAAIAELFQALRLRGYHPATLLGLVGTGAMVAGVYARGETAMPLVLALFMVFTLLWFVTGVVRTRPTANAAVTVLAFLYVGFLGSFAALILSFGDPGVGILLGAILATVANDVGAYFVGRSAGRTPLAPQISPNKTVEGFVGATVVTFAVCLIIVTQIDPWDGGRAFWLAAVASLAAPLGDLCESMIKRDLGLKDMGSTLPGHGGILDRIDALLVVIPATYYLLRLLA